jgi:serine/threonine protein kinase
MSTDPRTETVGDPASAASPEAPPVMSPGMLVGGRWEIVRALGSGGYATVYLARDRTLDRDVAVKVLRADRVSESSLRRLRREAALARDLAHPGLLRIFDVEEADGLVFLTLELAPGGSLRDRLRHGRLPVEEAVTLAAQIFGALAALHEVGVVHRDVKPGNVLLGAQGEVKLADFGLALLLGQDETRMTATEATIGTLEYLSPEQAMGEEVDARSDLYSAGLVLYEMLAGRLPHGARSSLGTVIARFRGRPPSVRALRSEVPRWLSRVVARLVERRREDRYATARAVSADLSRQRARLSASRRRLWAAGAAFLAGGLAVLGVQHYLESRGHQFSHIAADKEGRSIAAIDRRGRQLWRKEDVRTGPNFVSFRPTPGGPLRIAASLTPDSEFDISKTSLLSILDPQTGEELDRLALPEASGEFPEFSRRFSANLTAIDIDRDGADELIVDYVHNPFWPSFSVLVEPRLRRSRVVLVSSGHHWFKAAEDLDNDGRPELIYVGINNRMGWHQGIAAVRSPEDLGEPSIFPESLTPATTADRLARSTRGTRLQWYALAPRGLVNGSRDAIVIDRARREIQIAYARGGTYRVDFDGFPVETSLNGRVPGLSLRRDARQRSYLAMVEGTRLEDAFEPAGAIAAFDEARRLAGEARLPILELWLRQCLHRTRAATAPWPEVRAEMEAIQKASDHPSEIAFDTARALHRAGRLEEAVIAYRESFAQRGATDGRGEYETFEGVLLALTELGRFDEATSQVDRYCAVAMVEGSFCSHFREFVKWRRGEPIISSEIPSNIPEAPDLQRYWNYEFRLAAGISPAVLLPLVEAELGNASEAAVLFESLAAELAGRMGRIEEAARRALAARDRLELDLRRDLSLRVHAKLVRERAERWSAALAHTARNR